MAYITDQLRWQETMNTVTVDCSLDIAIHPAESDTVLLIIPGVDGSVNGYQDKYIRIAEQAQDRYGIAAVRIANPFISSFHWESNPRRILDYIASNTDTIAGGGEAIRIKIMAHSAGASIITKIAHEYDNITDLLLVNPAEKLDGDAIRSGLKKTDAKVTVIFGEKDPSVSFSEALRGDGRRVVVLEGADHNFSGENLQAFIELPERYLLS
ncbi:hypothetical protein FJZ39_03905 [Candidatus Saccharibacteria bacterium]|nr:hypothetical protein [Candidatus Saccharibacteria bacterium]